MTQPERQPERHPEAPATPPTEPVNPLLPAGDALLAAADDALRRALSGDSEAFLRENRQEGGQ